METLKEQSTMALRRMGKSLSPSLAGALPLPRQQRNEPHLPSHRASGLSSALSDTNWFFLKKKREKEKENVSVGKENGRGT